MNSIYKLLMDICANYTQRQGTYIQATIYTDHRVWWTRSPVQPESSDLPESRGHEAEMGRSNPDVHTAGLLTELLFIRNQR